VNDNELNAALLTVRFDGGQRSGGHMELGAMPADCALVSDEFGAQARVIRNQLIR
jgi:hypothetical protein